MRKREPNRRARRVHKVANAPKWLICCEGKSEVIYLSALVDLLAKRSQEQGKVAHGINFGVHGHCITKSIRGACGRQHIELYNRVVLCQRKGTFEKVWMLFDLDADCDPANKQNLLKAFRETIKRCETDSIVEPVWSVPCFEYWLALHTGNRIDVGSTESFKAKIRQLGKAAIQNKVPCDKKYRNQSGEHHCGVTNPVICEKVLDKPYYNSFQAFGGESGCVRAKNLCRQVYEAYNPARTKDSEMDFKAISCCSNIHVLIEAIYQYFDELPSRQ